MVPDAATYDQLLALVEALRAESSELRRVVGEQAEEIAELKRRLAADSSTSSRPPSSDAPWAKKPAQKRSSRSRSGRNPGKQPGASSASRRLVDEPDETVEIKPDRAAGAARHPCRAPPCRAGNGGRSSRCARRRRRRSSSNSGCRRCARAVAR